MKLTPALKFASLFLKRKKLKHSIRVAKLMTTKSEKRVALLHDVLEQDASVALTVKDGYYFITNYTEKLSLTRHECNAIRALTRNEGEAYATYITRVRCNKLATKVKIADIIDKPELKTKHKKALKKLLKD